MFINGTNTIIGYLRGRIGNTHIEIIARDNSMSINKAYAICKNNDKIIGWGKNFFQYLNVDVLYPQIIKVMRKNSEMSLKDISSGIKVDRKVVLDIIKEECKKEKSHITRRFLYKEDARISLFKYNDF